MSIYKGVKKGKIYISIDQEENKCRIIRLDEIYSVNHRTSEVRIRSNSVITFDYNNYNVECSNEVYQNFIIHKDLSIFYREANKDEIKLFNTYNEGNYNTNMQPDFPECGLSFSPMKDVITIKDKRFKLYISQEEIESRIKELANSINKHGIYNENNIPVLLVVLKGSFLFATELITGSEYLV